MPFHPFIIFPSAIPYQVCIDPYVHQIVQRKQIHQYTVLPACHHRCAGVQNSQQHTGDQIRKKQDPADDFCFFHRFNRSLRLRALLNSFLLLFLFFLLPVGQMLHGCLPVQFRKLIHKLLYMNHRLSCCKQSLSIFTQKTVACNEL